MKAFWYLRSLDSNNTMYSFKSNTPLFNKVTSLSFSNELKGLLNQRSGCKVSNYIETSRDILMHYFQNIINFYKLENVADYKNENVFGTTLKQFKFLNFFTDSKGFCFYITRSNNSFLNITASDNHYTNNFNLNIEGVYYFFRDDLFSFRKILVELNKLSLGNYIPNTFNFNNILSNVVDFRGVKESFKYTLDVKPKFGYNPVKVDLRAPSIYDPSILQYTKVLIFEQESESEFKNLNTVFKYFMVLDQNRRVMNRSLKINDVDISPRLKKFEAHFSRNSDFVKVNPKNIVIKPAFDAIIQYDENGDPFQVKGLSPSYNYELVKSNTSFINNYSISEQQTHDLDIFSPAKYNISSELSTPQSSVRSQKKLLFNQRLLHTTSVLVLPTKLNITVITNSYDVIHS